MKNGYKRENGYKRDESRQNIIISLTYTLLFFFIIMASSDLRIIDLAATPVVDMTKYSNDELFAFKEPRQFFHGHIYNLPQNWAIATIPTDVFSKFPSSFKGEDMLRIGNQELGVLLQQILVHAYEKLGFNANEIKPYEYGSYDNFFDFSNNFQIFDENNNLLVMPTENNFKKEFKGVTARFLIQFYGIFVHGPENCKKAKLSLKVKQMKIVKRDNAAAAGEQDAPATCLL